MSIMMAPGKVLYNLGSQTRLPAGEGRTFRVGDVSIAVFRTRNGRFYATQAHCPHKQGPLADGMTGDGQVVCPLHSYKFCLYTGEAVGNSCAALKTYPVFIDEAGDILLSIDE